MANMTLRKEVENVLGLKITDWSDTFKAAEIQGKMTNSHTNRILRIVCEKLEQLENGK